MKKEAERKEIERQRNLMLRILKRLDNQLINSGCLAWKEHLSNLRKIAKMRMRMQNMCVVVTFHAWQKLYKDNKKERLHAAEMQQKLAIEQKEAEESFNKVLHLKSTNSANFGSNQKEKSTFIRKASEIEYLNLYRPGMGTENVGVFLKSMVMMLRPKRILEIGAGYTTPFLLEALINNERVFDDGNLMESYFKNYIYNPKLIIIDNQSLGELSKVEGMEEIVNSEYTNFIEGNFEGKGEELFKEYGHFDFVWFDCGGEKEYSSFITEYWDYCSNYLFFHFTYANGKPNNNHKIIRDLIKGNPIIFDIVEPHKKRQGSITIVQKQI